MNEGWSSSLKTMRTKPTSWNHSSVNLVTTSNALAMARREFRKTSSLNPAPMILAMSFPKMAGNRALLLLKFDKRCKAVMVLLTRGSPEDLEYIVCLRAVCYVAKPYSLDDLVPSLKNLVSESTIAGLIDETLV